MEQIIERLRRHRSRLLIVITALLVPLLQNLASSWLETTLGQTPSRLLQLVAAGILLAILLWLIYVLVGESEPQTLISKERRPPRYAGLITLVSKPSPDKNKLAAHEAAIQYHLDSSKSDGEKLRVCWLVASRGEKGTVGEAERIRQVYGSQCRILIRELRDVFDVFDVYGLVNRIYEEAETLTELSLTSKKIIGDVTGGTTPMSVGMALACRSQGPMQYTYGGTKKTASIPILIEFGDSDE